MSQNGWGKIHARWWCRKKSATEVVRVGLPAVQRVLEIFTCVSCCDSWVYTDSQYKIAPLIPTQSWGENSRGELINMYCTFKVVNNSTWSVWGSEMIITWLAKIAFLWLIFTLNLKQIYKLITVMYTYNFLQEKNCIFHFFIIWLTGMLMLYGIASCNFFYVRQFKGLIDLFNPLSYCCCTWVF